MLLEQTSMAIIDNFEVTVEVDGANAPEYECVDNTSIEVCPIKTNHSNLSRRLSEKYIEVRADREFQIVISVNSEFTLARGVEGLIFDLYFDGVYVANSTLWRTELNGSLTGQKKRMSHVVRWESNKSYRKDFKFSDLAISQEHGGDDLEQSEKHIARGAIKLEILKFRTRLDAVNQHQIEGVMTKDPLEGASEEHVKPVPEKALKGRAITVTTGLGKEYEVPQKMVPEPTHISKQASGRQAPKRISRNPIQKQSKIHIVRDSAIATFVFMYRTRKALQELMIIERPRSPTPLADKDPSTLTLKESQQLIRELRATQQKLKEEVVQPIKRARSTSPAKADELEIVSSKRVKQMYRQAEIIELN